jgi:hypothetical protein
LRLIDFFINPASPFGLPLPGFAAKALDNPAYSP